MSTDTWPTLPDGVTGTQIRYRKILTPPMTTKPVRLGGSEPKVIVVETEKYVIWRVFSSSGRDFGEHCTERPEFESEFERRNSDEVYQNLADALNRLTRETGVVAMSINFNRSDVPLDWNDDIGGWAVED